MKKLILSLGLLGAGLLPYQALALQQTTSGGSSTQATATNETEGGKEQGGGMMMPHGMMVMKMLNKLNLSATQKSSIENCRTTFKTAVDPIMKQMHQAFESMGTIMTAKTLNQGAAHANHQTMQGLMNQIGNKEFTMHWCVAQALTYDQRVKLHGMMKEKQADRKAKWEKKKGEKTAPDMGTTAP